MERLTMRGVNGIWCAEGSVGRDDDGRVYTEAIDRLAAYEDTGLTPEEFDALCREMSNIRLMVGAKTYGELAKMVKDRRLVVLPCKVGDPVYVTYGEGYRLHIVDRIYITGNQEVQVRMRNPCTMSETLRLNASKFGKTVFLTEEEAEKALMEGRA